VKRSLSLRRESLSELTPEQLSDVAGGLPISLPNVVCAALEPSGRFQCTWAPTYCVCP
jgi:hypothetical protein